MSKVLIIGGAGYIGGLTTDILLDKNHYVTVYDNLLYENRYLKNINFVYGDVRDTNKISKLSQDYDTIIIMAALVGDHACSINPDLADEINFKSVKRLCENISIEKHIIFISTCSVYGAQDGLLDESSKTNPLSIYASTKLKAEECVKKRNGTIFRLGTVFGIGDTYSRIRLDLVVNILAMRALYFKEITINGGEQWRPIISVKDIANYIAEDVDKKYNDIFIISHENTTIRHLGETISNYIENVKINYVNISFQDARNYKVDNNKSLKIFNYKPNVTIIEELKKFIKLFRENRIKNPEDSIYNNGVYIQELYKMKNKLTI